MTLNSAGFLPSADCAPAERARRFVSMADMHLAGLELGEEKLQAFLDRVPFVEAGSRINQAKEILETALSRRQDAIKEEKLKARLIEEKLDVTLPGRGAGTGGLHPNTPIAKGAGGRGVLFSGDVLQALPDREHVSFMRSYPNRIPLSGAVVLRIAHHVRRFEFDRLYNNFRGVIPVDAIYAFLGGTTSRNMSQLFQAGSTGGSPARRMARKTSSRGAA